MTRQKNAIANGSRLENASWRTWWKQRNKLKTISPETLNWSISFPYRLLEPIADLASLYDPIGSRTPTSLGYMAHYIPVLTGNPSPSQLSKHGLP